MHSETAEYLLDSKSAQHSEYRPLHKMIPTRGHDQGLESPVHLRRIFYSGWEITLSKSSSLLHSELNHIGTLPKFQAPTNFRYSLQSPGGLEKSSYLPPPATSYLVCPLSHNRSSTSYLQKIRISELDLMLSWTHTFPSVVVVSPHPE